MSIIRQGFESADLDVPVVLPTLNLDFANSQSLDKRITFSRGSIGTRVNRNGLIETIAANQPRFDFDPISGECRGLLIEESRVNSLLYSQDFSNAVWSGNLTLLLASYNNVTGLDGTTSASTFTAIPLSGLNTIYQNFTCIASTTYTFSFYVKLGTLPSSSFKIAVYNLTGSSFIAVDVVPTQTLSTSSWTRVSYTFTTPVGCISARVYPYRNGTPSQNNGTFYLWGAQVEAGSFPTSYIPTVASTVPRSADNASMTGTNFSSWYNQTGYSVFTSHIAPIPQTIYFPRIFNIGTDASDINRLNFYHTPSTIGYKVGMSVIENNSITNVDFSTPTSQGTKLKLAGAFAENNSSLSINGSIIGTDIKCSINSVTRNILNIGSANNSQGYLNSTIAKFTYYPKALSPAELQYLTQ